MTWLNYAQPHADLREFVERAEGAGELLRVAGANWDLELGALAEAATHKRTEAPALLFESITGYADGYRVLSASSNSTKRLALLLGFPQPRTPTDLGVAYRDRMKTFAPIAPRTVASGAVMENVDRDGEVDLWKFPVPRIHELDGGRYIGTEDVVVMRDPDEGWVNAATYRVMVHDKNHAGIWMSPGKHGRRISERYFAQGLPCPVPRLLRARPAPVLGGESRSSLAGLSEYDYAGMDIAVRPSMS